MKEYVLGDHLVIRKNEGSDYIVLEHKTDQTEMPLTAEDTYELLQWIHEYVGVTVEFL